jgi:hypothetical protein
MVGIRRRGGGWRGTFSIVREDGKERLKRVNWVSLTVRPKPGWGEQIS